MNEGNKSERENKGMWSHLVELCRRWSKKRDEPFPPKLKCWQWIIVVIGWGFILGGLLFVADQLCFQKLPQCVCCTYIAFGFVVCGLVIDRWLRHDLIVHRARLEDISEVEALFVEASTVQRTLHGPMSDQEYFDSKKNNLLEEVRRLKEDVGKRGWTEYQVLSLTQMLVDFLEVDELIERAELGLAELKEYAEDSSYRYEWEQFCDWDNKIRETIEKIEDPKVDQEQRDSYVAKLRASLKTLLEHVDEYYAYWAEGSAIIRGIITCGVMAIPIIVAMGLLPLLHPAGDKVFRIFNWGLLGITGGITAVLLSLRKSDFVEVGSTEGKKELWRAVLSAVLGLVAGILLYSMIAGGILSGSAFPSEKAFPEITLQISGEKVTPNVLDIGRCIFWGIASGFSFEWVFDHLRSTTGERK